MVTCEKMDELWRLVLTVRRRRFILQPRVVRDCELPWVQFIAILYAEGVTQALKICSLCNAFSVMQSLGYVTQGRPLRGQPCAEGGNRVAVTMRFSCCD